MERGSGSELEGNFQEIRDKRFLNTQQNDTMEPSGVLYYKCRRSTVILKRDMIVTMRDWHVSGFSSLEFNLGESGFQGKLIEN